MNNTILHNRITEINCNIRDINDFINKFKLNCEYRSRLGERINLMEREKEMIIYTISHISLYL